MLIQTSLLYVCQQACGSWAAWESLQLCCFPMCHELINVVDDEIIG